MREGLPYNPAMVIIAGDGRNVGKTWFACRIISSLSVVQEVIAIKVSPHLHSIEGQKDYICKCDDYYVFEEKRVSGKDSSLMLQAGASKSFFVAASDENLDDAFSHLTEIIRDKIVVCESGGLRKFIQPGLFLFITDHEGELRKPGYLKYQPVIIRNIHHQPEPDPSWIHAEDGCIKMISPCP